MDREPVDAPADGGRLFSLNLSYLMEAQRELQGDPVRAQLLFGISADFADWLSRASAADLVELARSPVVMFRLDVPPEAFHALANTRPQGERVASRLHAALRRCCSQATA